MLIRPKPSTIGAVLILLLCGSVQASAQSYTLSPSPFLTALDNSGHIINGACVWTYQAGTTTAVATYSDTAGTPNTNPVKADAAGRFTAYLIPGQNYKFVYENTPCTVSPPVHGPVLRTADNVSGVPASAATVDVTGTAGETISAGNAVYLSDGSGGKTTGQWYKADSSNPYSSTLLEVGIAPSAITATTSGTIRLAGTVPGLGALSVGSEYFVGTTGALTTTAPANRRHLGHADSATTLIVSAEPPPPLGVIRVTSSVTGNQSGAWFALPSSPVILLTLTNASQTTIQSIPAGFDGQRIDIVSQGAGEVDLSHLDPGGTTGQKLFCFAVSNKTPLAPGVGTASLVYDLANTRWRLVNHEQGAWITPTFAAGNYTGGWTLAAGDVVTQAYYLKGRMLVVSFYLQTITMAGTPTIVAITNAAWGGFAANQSMLNGLVLSDAGAANVGGFAQVTPAATSIQILKYAGTWGNATDTTSVLGQITFEVQ